MLFRSNKLSKLEMLKSWEEGLNELDIQKMRRALKNGIDVDTYVNGDHPVNLILDNYRGSHGFVSSMTLDFGLTSKRSLRREKTSKKSPFEIKRDILDLMLDRGLSLLAVPKKGKNEMLIDSILMKDDATLISKLVVQAIIQSIEADTESVYRFDIEDLLAEHIKSAPVPEGDAQNSDDENDDQGDIFILHENKEAAETKLKRLEKIHEQVKSALESPQTKKEKALMHRHKDKLSFWLQDFKKPDQEKMDEWFPVDKDALQAAQDEADKHHSTSFGSMSGFGRAAENENDDKIITLKKENPEDILAELEQYTGIEQFKVNMRSLLLRVRFNQARTAKGMSVDEQNYHTAFLGNPGTGKTTSSRLKARMLYSLGLTGPRYLETSRDGIIGQYVGHTEKAVHNLIESADILFIDEAYSLVDGSSGRGDFGHKAVDTLVAAMGNRKDPFTLFLAGYKDPMKRFIESNEGLSSRLKTFEELRDFTIEELKVILDANIAEQGYSIDADAVDFLCKGVEEEKQRCGQKNFGNARVIVSLVQELPNQMAYRLGYEVEGDFDKLTTDQLSHITIEDVKKTLAQRNIILSSGASVETSESQDIQEKSKGSSWEELPTDLPNLNITLDQQISSAAQAAFSKSGITIGPEGIPVMLVKQPVYIIHEAPQPIDSEFYKPKNN